jgi:hypothetical protein
MHLRAMRAHNVLIRETQFHVTERKVKIYSRFLCPTIIENFI